MTNKEKLHELDQCWQEISSRRWWRMYDGFWAIVNGCLAVNFSQQIGFCVMHVVCAIGMGALCAYEWHKLANALTHRKSLLEARDG